MASNQEPKVSICTPIYGVEKYIERCARSLFEQTYTNIEYIFVNDCTKDNSIDILLKTIQSYPSRKSQIRIINHDKNCGLGCARNTAIAAATGDFIMHVDSDDYIERITIEECVKKQIETEADIVSCNALKHRTDFTEKMQHTEHLSPKEYCLNVLQRNAHVCIWGRLIRTALYKNNNIHVEPGINMGEDYQVIGKLFFYSHKTAIVNNFLYHYDCTNIGSYSNLYSKSKQQQSWRSFDIVKIFFENKGEEFTEATSIGELKIIISHFIISGKIPDGKYYYIEARRRLKDLDNNIRKKESIAKRLVLFFSFNYQIMKVYTRFSRSINIAIKKNKKQLL